MADLPEATPWSHALCMICGERAEIAASLPGAQLPRRDGFCQGIAICGACVDRLTHKAAQDGAQAQITRNL